MPAPILLVDDDLGTIAAVKRALTRDGFEVVLATSAADAVIAFGHHLPALMVLSPNVEGGRAEVVLEELKGHPDGQLLKVLLLGSTLPGYPHAVTPLPIEAEPFLQLVHELIGGTDATQGWQVFENPATRTDEVPAVQPVPEPEAWRATRRSPAPGSDAARLGEVSPASAEAVAEDIQSAQFSLESHADIHSAAPEPRPTTPTATPPPHSSSPLPDASPGQQELEARLFGDLEEQLGAQVAAEMTAQVESNLAKMPVDSELQKLEDEVRAEAARRRQARALPKPPSPAPPPEPTPPETVVADDGASTEAAFAALDAVPSADEDDEEARVRAQMEAGKASIARAEAAAAEARKSLEKRQKAEAQQERVRASELDEAQRAAVAAEDLVRHERSVREKLETELEELKAKLAQVSEGETKERERAERAASDLQGELNQQNDKLTNAEAELSSLRDQLLEKDNELASARGALANAELERDAERKEKAQVQNEAATLAGALGDVRAERARLEEEVGKSETAAREATEESEHTEERLQLVRSELEELQKQHEALTALSTQQIAEARELVKTGGEQLENSVQELAAARSEAQELKVRVDELTQSLNSTTARAKEAETAGAQAVTRFQAQLEESRTERDALAQKVASADDERGKVEAQLSKTQQRVDELTAKTQQLEDAQRLPLKIPDRPRLSVARAGPVKLGELARLMVQLCEAKVELKAELAVPGGRRTLWLKGGEVIAAETTFQHESMLDRARRDGLIDARQEKELKLLRNATPRETLAVLKSRGWIRDEETVPMAQRYVEQVVLEALSEPGCDYRLSEDAITGGAMEAAPLKTLLPMLAEALRRSLPADRLLESLGGSEAVPFTTDSVLDPRALGFSDKERRMLSYLDGEANVEDLALASGLKPESAYRALMVAKLLGLLDLKLPDRPSVSTGPELDLQRLEAKYDQVQDADYFSILGLPRDAGAEEVERAWLRLSEEFDPIRYSGHPDASVQQRATVVHGLIEEAGRALRDDRRREEYARHLVD
ncbi:MAG: hypothetical protein QM723_29755 [Myxococcaceae bacterium]